MGRLTLLFLTILSASLMTIEWARAESVVAVYWKIRYRAADGRLVSSSLPSGSYLQNLAHCGHVPDLSIAENFVPLSALRCRGVLDFSQTKIVRARVVSLLKRAEKKGIDRVGGIGMRALLRRIESIDFAISPYGVFHAGAQDGDRSRFMAINIASERLVIINQEFWRQIKSSRGQDIEAILLHEAFGALNLDDADYQLSTFLVRPSKDGGPVSSGGVRPGRGGRIRVAEGGASVVGRGGDSNELLLKASILKLVEKQLVVSGVDKRFVPEKAAIRAMIRDAKVLFLPEAILIGKTSFCSDQQSGGRDPSLCGDFLIEDANGVPTIVASREWSGFSSVAKRPALVKIYTAIITQMTLRKMQRI